MIRRLQTLPAAADAEDGSLYLEINSNGRILRRLLKDYRLSAFFDVTVADLGDGHRGYAGAGYDGLGSNYAVNAGGSSQYAGVGAISEQYRDLVSSTFERVGTFTLATTVTGLGAYNNQLYQLRVTSIASIIPIDLDSGVGTAIELNTSVNNPQGFTIMNGVAYYYANDDNHFVAYDIDADSSSNLSTTVDVTEVVGLAHASNIVYVIYRNSSNEFFIAPLNTSNGSLGTGQRLTGYESDDSEGSTEGLTAVNDVLYMSTQAINPHLYEVNPSNGNLTLIGDISPSNADINNLAELGGYIYGHNASDNGLYRAEATQGNRWVATFPSTTTEVAADETTLKLFTERGGTEVELTKDDNITDALVFASDYDGATAHTIADGDMPEWALYNSNDEQLYEGAVEAIYSELAAA